MMFTNFILNQTISCIVYEVYQLCLNTREDILCSNHSIVNGADYSVVFGSTECRQCNNWCLWTTILYAVTDPFLTYMLHTHRFT